MSCWIHANGFIVLNQYYNDEEILEKIKTEIKGSLGNIIGYEETDSVSCKNMPYGSEGSFRYEITTTEEHIYVNIIGDIRDRYPDYLDNIEKWYKESIEELIKLNYCYLDKHVFTAYCEYGGRIIMFDEGIGVGVIKCPEN